MSEQKPPTLPTPQVDEANPEQSVGEAAAIGETAAISEAAAIGEATSIGEAAAIGETTSIGETAATSSEGAQIKEVYFPWQADQEKKPEEALTPDQIALKEAQRLGRIFALICFGLFAGAVVISIFVSIYRAVHAPPQVWIPIENTNRKGYVMPPARLRTCVARLRRLDQEMEQESKNLWFRVRKGNRYYLTAWQDWSRDWQHRMDVLLKQCPLRGEDEISRSFRRASTQMLELHKRQHKVFSDFFSKTAWLFREVREGMHVLQEELRQ
jgi:hypothetical protein